MSKGVIGYIPYCQGRVCNFHAALVKVSIALVVYIPVCHTSYLFSIPALRAASSITNVPNVTCRLNLLGSALLYSISHLLCSVVTTKCHKLSNVSVSVLCSKCLLYVDDVFQGKAHRYFVFYQVSPYQ